jgi:hypothetical protein
MTTIKIINTETGEETEREMTQAEVTQLDLDNAEALAYKKLQEDNAREKAALLAKLGITEDEARLLLS